VFEHRYRKCVETRRRGSRAGVAAAASSYNAWSRNAPEGFEIETLQELGVILSRHIASLTGKEPAFEMCPGLLETRFYAAHGIPAFAYGPGLLTVSHGPNEFVPILNITQCAAIYALTAAEVLR
jgi:acetylornithine deacetylase/succinyl-diaminopimelate desuccinylase-like protein